jgi:hypothetical protein
VTIDPGDFDSLGAMADVVVTLRGHAIERASDVIATVSAPPGRHRLTLTARPSGHAVLGVRYGELTRSRRNVIAESLRAREWDVDEDGEGATRRLPPGTEHTTVAFEALAVLTLGGAPSEPRVVTAIAADGSPVPLA